MHPRARNDSTTQSTTAEESAPPWHQTVDVLRRLAIRGLPGMWRPEHGEFAQTTRLVPGPKGPVLRPEGLNQRYSAIAALGCGRLEVELQRQILAGRTAADFATRLAERSVGSTDSGVIALAAWAAAEVAHRPSSELLSALDRLLKSEAPVPTVDLSWMICAALATTGIDQVSGLAQRLAERILARAPVRLLGAQGPGGLFPHVLPASSQSRLRAHVGCFADQVYPIQALARVSALDDGPALDAAGRCADRIVALQGECGQWWWHYDARGDRVVEGFPVYSVHQHAMAPMALRELQRAGGRDHTKAVARGLEWLHTHPEVVEDLIDSDRAVVWRKVGRREPPKFVRKVAAAATALQPAARLPGVDAAFPPTVVDRECRPYELGWLLYAWPDTASNEAHAND